MFLTSWGWSPELQRALDALARTDLVPARVARHDRTGYLVVTERGERFARIPGHLRHDAPAVGDWIALDPAEPPTIRALLPRRTAFTRAAAGREARPQVVAANVDTLLIVAGLDGDLNLRRLERYLAIAASSSARPVVVLNKADVAQDLDERLAEVGAIAHHVDVVVVSAATGAGIEALRPRVGETAALVGSSGVGKSSLANRLLGHDASCGHVLVLGRCASCGGDAMPVGRLRAKDGRGTHTTTARHLLPVPGGGVLLDTPGMRELGLWDAERGVEVAFGDVAELAARCRFSDCAHDTEPGCAVRGGVSPERLAAWRKLQREARSQALRSDERASRAAARAWGKLARDTVRGKRERLS